METAKKITKKDLIKAWLLWIIFNHSCYNYERMQGMAVNLSMVPLLNKLYGKGQEEQKKEALRRELMFFNTEVIWGASIIGLAAGMEEQVAMGAEIDPDAIVSLKSGLMGPLAGIGDTISQGIIMPLVLSIAIGITLEGNAIVGPILVLVIMTAYQLAGSYISYFLAYNKGSEAIFSMLESGSINKFIQGAGIVGCTVMGALIASYVSLSTTIEINTEYSSFNLQTGFFDQVVPCILPLALTMICWKLIGKGWSTTKLLVVLFVVGILGSLVGIF